ncbi:MAG: recombinase family protein [Clostridia bacterium]|nr:recombinase family protein [Clostridia bacterium]
MPYKSRRIDDDIKRAALYARVSTEEQAMHGVSLDAQKERLIQYAKENGLTIVDTYVDEGISARKRYTRRAEFMRMLEDVKAKKIDVVLFIKLDRWFRNIADYYEVQAILDRYKVNWIATDEDYDTTTANGRLALNIKLAIAQDESDRTSERIKFVFKNMVKEGRVISGQTPLGFKIESKHVVIDEDTVEIIRTMFNKYIDCRSMKATARYILSEYGISIDIKSMKRMLTNAWYIGEAYDIKGWCPAIIDEKTFRLAKSIVQVRSARYDGTRSDRVYLFTGLIFCGCCGKRMTTYSCANKNPDGTVRQSFIYYRCPGRTMRTCDMGKQFNQEKLEQWLVDNIKAEAQRYNTEITSKKKAAPKKVIDTAKIMSKIEKLKDLYINDLLPKEIYEKDYTALMSLLKEATQQQTTESKPIDLSVFDGFEDMYKTLTEESKKAFWSRVIKQIIVSESGELLITFN